ncbi:MAG: hypothetical protein JSR25_14535 [Proteobacteria bacterium]|nr:hypothetical protein [Pseudomonadota bacterium]
MSAKDLKSKLPTPGWTRPRNMGTRDSDLEEIIRAGLKIYGFEVRAASEADLLSDAVRRRKNLN